MAELRRRLFPGRSVQVLNAAGHTAGQMIPGDVVVVGNYAPTIEQDAAGSVTRYKDMDALLASVQGAKGGAPAPSRGVEVPAPAPESRQPPAPVPAPPPHDAPKPTWDEPVKKPLPDLESMGRPALISLAAELFPKQRPWATMPATAIRSAMTELHQKRG